MRFTANEVPLPFTLALLSFMRVSATLGMSAFWLMLFCATLSGYFTAAISRSFPRSMTLKCTKPVRISSPPSSFARMAEALPKVSRW